jgi:hypothetical protein
MAKKKAKKKVVKKSKNQTKGDSMPDKTPEPAGTITRADIEAALANVLASFSTAGAAANAAGAAALSGTGQIDAAALTRMIQTVQKDLSDTNAEEFHTGALTHSLGEFFHIAGRRAQGAATFDRAMDTITLAVTAQAAGAMQRRATIANTLDMLGLSENPTMQDAIVGEVIKELAAKGVKVE